MTLMQVDFISEAAAIAAAQIQENETVPPQVFLMSTVTGGRNGTYDVLWDDGKTTSEALDQDKVEAVWEPSPQEEAEGITNFMVGKFIMVEFSRVRKHLGHVQSYNKRSKKHYIVYEDGKDNGDLDLLAVEKPWGISTHTFEI